MGSKQGAYGNLSKVYVVGIGPGDQKHMTQAAAHAIKNSDVIVGYGVYTDLISHLIEGKAVETTPMKQEAERCRIALSHALVGRTVALVCSGDAGVYGMAGLMMETAAAHPSLDIEVISGVTAACFCAGVLGAPLMHDFAVISLSDLLTPWGKIEKRLRLAADADFVVSLYNPSSKKRADYLKRACECLMEYKSPETQCGFVRNAGRDGEQKIICSLGELAQMQVDMFTTVIVGNSETKVINGRLVTPRGYKEL